MNYYEQMFNPQYVNEQNYQEFSKQLQDYNNEQNKEISNAVKSIHDYCEAMKKLDPQHQQIANRYCLIEIAKSLNW